MKKEKLFKKAWKNIEKNFDWNKVQKTMKALDCKWFDSPVPPTIERLKETARHLVEVVCTSEFKYTGTGGFNARRHKAVVSLYFSVDEWYYEPKHKD